MLFNVILANPPYQSGLYLDFLHKALSHLKEDGICVFLQPTSKKDEIADQYLIDVVHINKNLAEGFFSNTTFSSDIGICVYAKSKSANIKYVQLDEIVKSHIMTECCQSSVFSKSYDDANANSIVRKSLFSQYFTPPELSIKMIELAGQLQGKYILDVSAGNGNLLAAALCAGADSDKCYGIELDYYAYNECRCRLSSYFNVPIENIVCADALNEESYTFSAQRCYKAMHVKLLQQRCILTMLKFPLEVQTKYNIDLSDSVGKDMLNAALHSAVVHNVKILFDEPTTLQKKLDNCAVVSLQQLEILVAAKKLNSFDDLD